MASTCTFTSNNLLNILDQYVFSLLPTNPNIEAYRKEIAAMVFDDKNGYICMNDFDFYRANVQLWKAVFKTFFHLFETEFSKYYGCYEEEKNAFIKYTTILINHIIADLSLKKANITQKRFSDLILVKLNYYYIFSKFDQLMEVPDDVFNLTIGSDFMYKCYPQSYFDERNRIEAILSGAPDKKHPYFLLE